MAATTHSLFGRVGGNGGTLECVPEKGAADVLVANENSLRRFGHGSGLAHRRSRHFLWRGARHPCPTTGAMNLELTHYRHRPQTGHGFGFRAGSCTVDVPILGRPALALAA